MQKKKRVYELARQYGKTDKEVLDVLKSHNVDVTSRLSGVDDNGCAIWKRPLLQRRDRLKGRLCALSALTTRAVLRTGRNRKQDGNPILPLKCRKNRNRLLLLKRKRP